jgi:hypothetical protein
MLRTIEAVIDEQGSVQLLETVVLSSKHRALVTILEEDEFMPAESPATMLRPFGLCAGEFIVPANFNDPLPDAMLAEFEGA